MDTNEFFREATLRICGNLEIEKAIVFFLQYVQDVIPVDRLFLEYYDKNEKVMRTIVDATPEKGESVDLITPLSEGARDFLREKYGDGTPPPYYYEKPYEVSVARELLDFHKQEAESILVLPLGTPEIPIGIATFISTHSHYNDTHLDVVSLLKDPFQIAMSNALKHRNELRLFDRDFFFEATRRICGNLEIEEGLHSCIKYISQFMPADRMYLQRYQPDLDSMHLIARTDKEHNEKMNTLVPLTKEAKIKLTELAQVWRDGKLPPILIINDPADEPVTKCMLEALNEPMSSALSLPLVIGNTIIGTLVLLAEGNNRYSKENAELFSVLKLPFFVALSNTLKHREVIALKELLADDNRYLRRELRRISGDEIVGTNFGLKDTMYKVQQVASLDSPVLLLGETGVGKDVIANAIHYSSSRSNGPFVKVNCGAIPDTLIDSELFGHEKGAFTGALTQKRGRFERADTGTIFLDEIGELPLQAQVRLLTVLQSREIERVGGVKTIPLDIRIIAATNRNLETMVQERAFREDLWFRLNVFPVWIPPLRERLSDIPALLHHFIVQKSKELKLPDIPKVSPGATEALMSYSWPGNVRELQNVVERELILNPSGPLDFKHSIMAIDGNTGLSRNHVSGTDSLDEMTRHHIRKVLVKTGGKIHGSGGAAELLGINANTLRNRMNKLGIRYKRR